MNNFDWNNEEVFISGGSGSLGNALTKTLLEKYKPKGIRIFSRGELPQWEMKNRLHNKYGKDVPIEFLLGDVRDRKRLELATEGCSIIIHAAAQKQVPGCEDNPLEAIQTNIIGSQNILYAALKNKTKKVIGISSDKACYPLNLYGTTKKAMEHLFIQGNVYSGGRNPRFSCCRYGNVIGSRGSVIPLFKKQAKNKKFTLTDKEMTRFWITLEEVSEFVIKALEIMKGEEIFVPQMSSCKVIDIVEPIAKYMGLKKYEIEEIGIRPGEKLHEALIAPEEAERTETKAFDEEGIFYFKVNPEGTKIEFPAGLKGGLTSDNNHIKMDYGKLTEWINKEN